jgi:hypothetical protein
MMGLESKTPLMKFLGLLINASLMGFMSVIIVVMLRCDGNPYYNFSSYPYMFLAAHFFVCFVGGPPLILLWLTGSKAFAFTELVYLVAKEDPFLENITILVTILSIIVYTSVFLYTFLEEREKERKNKVE